MNKTIEKATTEQLGILLPLVRAFHAHEGIAMSEADRDSVTRRLLADPTWGRIWLIFDGADVAGYIAICTGFSIEFRGNDAFVDEFYVRPESRGRGLGTRALQRVRIEAKALGIRALHLEVDRSNLKARKLYANAEFEAREDYMLMTSLL
ncbi:MAG: GNAT family N-acetyltransferase [Gammaproteobacteria bacterium]|nr:GNAT family N-acetyltransferase [Gammaproteobacteria bacterium]MDH5304969.1 GNAT family N-acetyltransferase [Gammaproteobacteria bacterium]MDH5322005.1 GNAT family N-acetyltransferase [Gammaproteobacteria bacterium]